ncbi:MAG: hypothetical protein ACRC6V_06920 [Bacteroidales bacterium]
MKTLLKPIFALIFTALILTSCNTRPTEEKRIIKAFESFAELNMDDPSSLSEVVSVTKIDSVSDSVFKVAARVIFDSITTEKRSNDSLVFELLLTPNVSKYIYNNNRYINRYYLNSYYDLYAIRDKLFDELAIRTTLALFIMSEEIENDSIGYGFDVYSVKYRQSINGSKVLKEAFVTKPHSNIEDNYLVSLHEVRFPDNVTKADETVGKAKLIRDEHEKVAKVAKELYDNIDSDLRYFNKRLPKPIKYIANF